MSIFLFNIALILTLSFFLYHKGHVNLKNQNQVFLFVVFVLLYITHACKDPFSLLDTPGYVDGYIEVKNHSMNELIRDGLYSLKAEKGYVILTKIISYLFPSNQMLFIFTSYIILVGYYVAFSRYSLIPWLSVLLFAIGGYNQSLFVLRQHMAMSIVLFSYPCIINRRFIPFFFYVLAAFFIHQTAIIFFPIYFLYGMKRKMLVIAIYSIIGFILIFFMQNCLDLAILYFEEYEGYVKGVDDAQGQNWKMSGLLVMLLLFRIYIMKQHIFDIGIERLLTHILLLGCILSIAGIGLVPISRLNMYYTGMTCLIFPNTLYYVNNNSLRWFYGCGYFLFLFYFYLTNLPAMSNYRFIWE